MSGENQVDLAELQRERDKRQAALDAVTAQVAAIEAEETRKREEKEQRAREIAKLQKNLKVCHETIGWIERRLIELKEIAHGQAGTVLQGTSEGYFTLKATLQESAEWERELLIFKEYEVSIPKEIKKLGAA